MRSYLFLPDERGLLVRIEYEDILEGDIEIDDSGRFPEVWVRGGMRSPEHEDMLKSNPVYTNINLKVHGLIVSYGDPPSLWEILKWWWNTRREY